MMSSLPEWLDPSPWVDRAKNADAASVRNAIYCDSPGIREFSLLLSDAADGYLEEMAQRASALTKRHFGRTVSLYVPLYLSNFCSGGCVYCGFASDREQPRTRLNHDELLDEVRAIRKQGFNDVLLLTGERTAEAGFEYLLESVNTVSQYFHNVSVESFSMTTEEYALLGKAGCTGVTLYQETYNTELYADLHRWGGKKDYEYRIDAPSRAMAAGMRVLGLGVLLGLDDPLRDAICTYQHARFLLKKYWRSGVMISFPRICAQQGGYEPAFIVDDRMLARLIFAFRICLADVSLVLSTREDEKLRDGMAGVGVNRMSVASKTSVGGYRTDGHDSAEQFEVTDTRDVHEFCSALEEKNLEPVFKNWDSVYRS
jgi:2-iminoacetate synthase